MVCASFVTYKVSPVQHRVCCMRYTSSYSQAFLTNSCQLPTMQIFSFVNEQMKDDRDFKYMFLGDHCNAVTVLEVVECLEPPQGVVLWV